jgi:hypothetical protein
MLLLHTAQVVLAKVICHALEDTSTSSCLCLVLRHIHVTYPVREFLPT